MIGDPNHSSRHLQGQSGWRVKGKEGADEDGGGGEVLGYLCPQATTWRPSSEMPSPLTLGQARESWTRINSSGRQEMAGKGAGEVLEEGGEGAHSRHCAGLEGIQNWIRKTGLVHVIHPFTVQSSLFHLLQCFSAIISYSSFAVL